MFQLLSSGRIPTSAVALQLISFDVAAGQEGCVHGCSSEPLSLISHGAKFQYFLMHIIAGVQRKSGLERINQRA
jgi:hypothetical protein